MCKQRGQSWPQARPPRGRRSLLTNHQSIIFHTKIETADIPPSNSGSPPIFNNLLPTTGTPREKTLTAEILKMRTRKAKLEKQLETTREDIRAKQAGVEQMLVVGDSDSAALAKAERQIGDAERQIKSLIGAISRLDGEICNADAEIIAAADAAQRKEAAAAHEAELRDLHPAATDLVKAATRYAEITGRLGRTIFDAKQLNGLVQGLADEIPAATARIEAEMRLTIAQILNGSPMAKKLNL
jgi:hypothetical protein